MTRRTGLSRRLAQVGALGAAAATLAAVALHGVPTDLTPTSQPTVLAAGTQIAMAAPSTPPDSPPSTTTTAPAATTTATPVAAVAAPPAPTGARQAAANAAVSYAQSLGWTTGIAIVDTQTGQVTTAGSAAGLFPTESTVKVLLASNLLANGEMSGQVATTATQMVEASDDNDADALYYMAGGDDVVGWAAARYGITNLGMPPVNGAGQWGSTQVSPKGMATFLADAKNDPTVGPWLTSTMAAMHPVADDGTDQLFGLKVADPTAAVKQGWGGDVAGMDAETTPSIGYVNGGRYAVAIYTLHSPMVAQSTSQAVVTHQAELLMPGGRMPAL
ncbi:MAG: hypothetical protein LCH98_04510 [Actinobacteria bacterium]|nr:hypothetical protein [Actinomycetota bacterium]